MLLADLRLGDRVMIVARDDFYAFVDGWRGTVKGFQSGVAVVVGPGMDGGVQSLHPDTPEITLFVPSDQLTHTI